MKLIELNKCWKTTKRVEVFAMVDDEDYESLNQFNWYAEKMSRTYYAARRKAGKECDERTMLKMHRVIMNASDPNVTIDHIDHNGLNNQKSNLRICTKAWNNRNKSSHKKSTSKFVGVSYDKFRKKWKANFFHNGIRILEKRFDNEIDAAVAYNEVSKKYNGEFANLNSVT